jgi:hypothetical protein
MLAYIFYPFGFRLVVRAVFPFGSIRQWSALDRSRTDRAHFQWEIKFMRSIFGKPDAEVNFGCQHVGWEDITKVDLKGTGL